MSPTAEVSESENQRQGEPLPTTLLAGAFSSIPQLLYGPTVCRYCPGPYRCSSEPEGAPSQMLRSGGRDRRTNASGPCIFQQDQTPQIPGLQAIPSWFQLHISGVVAKNSHTHIQG